MSNILPAPREVHAFQSFLEITEKAWEDTDNFSYCLPTQDFRRLHDY